MTELKKILVGVDPCQSRGGRLSPPTTEAVKQALWLAERVAGEIVLLAVLDPPPRDEVSTLSDEARNAAEREIGCRKLLHHLVEQAAQRRVRAVSKVAYGTGWIELTREAIGASHDLVVVGTRNQGLFRRALFGSTAMKLLKNCPAPVWVTKPEPYLMPSKILVASDFSPVSDKALRLAVRIGSSCRAETRLIHVLKQPFAHLSDTEEPEARAEESYHQRGLDAAKHRLEEQIARVLADAGAAELLLGEDTALADYTIEKYVEAHSIDLLVMGTNARQGLAGVFVGNTAERLLPSVRCSLLVVKPDGFTCPVCLEPQHGGELAALQ